MSLPLLRTGLVAAFALALATPVFAGPGGPGGPRPGGPGFFHPGPSHGHGLPSGARELWIGSMLYFVAAGTYYLWNGDRNQYEVVTPPPAIQAAPAVNYDVIAYPARGQSPDQQAQDRYECHSWAVSQSGFDPATAQYAPPASTSDIYRRALGACLTGRGYTVN